MATMVLFEGLVIASKEDAELPPRRSRGSEGDREVGPNVRDPRAIQALPLEVRATCNYNHPEVDRIWII